MGFDELGLGPKTLQAISEAGYTEPTPIQAGAIPAVFRNRDVLGIAQTGTGKTASFTLPMIDVLSRGRAKARMPRSLILEPTRELAAQVAENFDKYGKYHKLSMALLIGGVAFGEQNKKLMQGVDVLIATPGRLLDHFERGRLLLSGVQMLVVDEADRMLDMGFIPDIERIFKMTPFTRQTLFFSATMPKEIQRIVDTFLHNPERIEVARPTSTAETVSQYLIRLDSSDFRRKIAALRSVVEQDDFRNAIIFCNRKRDVDKVASALKKLKYKASPIHGDLPQSVRMQTLDNFKTGQINLLIASDVAARGLDIPDVSHVLNYDVPIHAEDYIHRIGRTGRAGKSGTAFTLCTPPDAKHLAAIQELIGRDIPEAGSTKTPAAVDAPVQNEDADKDDEKKPARPVRKRRPVRGRAPRVKEIQDAKDAKEENTPAPTPPANKCLDAEPPKEHAAKTKKPARTRNEKKQKPAAQGASAGFGTHIPDFFKSE